MKTLLRISIITMALGLMTIADMPQLPVHLVPDAEAIFGVRRRSFRRGVIIGAAAEGNAGGGGQSAAAQQEAATAQQQSATAQQQSATAQQQAATAQQQAAAQQQKTGASAPSGKPLALGTVVSTLPQGCVSTPVGGKEYYYCGGNFYRAAFQGNKLVYVTTKPE